MADLEECGMRIGNRLDEYVASREPETRSALLLAHIEVIDCTCDLTSLSLID